MKNIYIKLVSLDGDGVAFGGGVVPLDFHAMIMITTAVQLDPLDRPIDRPRFGISVGYLFSAFSVRKETERW